MASFTLVLISQHGNADPVSRSAGGRRTVSRFRCHGSPRNSRQRSIQAIALERKMSLLISVWKDEQLTREVVVRPDGMFSFPLVGDVRQKIERSRRFVLIL